MSGTFYYNGTTPNTKATAWKGAEAANVQKDPSSNLTIIYLGQDYAQ